MNRATLTDSNPDGNQGLHHYLFIICLDRCDGSFNTIGQVSGRIRVPNETEDVNLKVFSMMKRTDKLKALTKHILCNCECKFEGRKCDSAQKWNNDKCQCEGRKQINHCACKDNYAWDYSIFAML